MDERKTMPKMSIKMPTITAMVDIIGLGRDVYRFIVSP
jgi:hypothetical protein